MQYRSRFILPFCFIILPLLLYTLNNVDFLASKIIENMKNEYADGCKNLCIFTQNIDSNGMREIANAGAETAEKIFGVFGGNDEDGYSYIISSKSVKLREKSRDINKALDGKGGGSDTMIQGSVKADSAAIKAFFDSFED